MKKKVLTLSLLLPLMTFSITGCTDSQPDSNLGGSAGSGEMVQNGTEGSSTEQTENGNENAGATDTANATGTDGGDAQTDSTADGAGANGENAGDANNVETGADTSAGKTDTEKTDIADLDYDTIYKNKLDVMFDLIDSEGWNYSIVNDEESVYGLLEAVNGAMYYSEETVDIRDTFGYGMKDLSGDGIPEMYVGKLNEDKDDIEELYALYTVKNGKAENVIVSYARSSFDWLGGNLFSYYGSDSAASSRESICRLAEDGTHMENLSCYYSDWVEGKNGDGEIVYYYVENGDFDNPEKISEDDWGKKFEQFTKEAPKNDKMPAVSFNNYRGAEVSLSVFFADENEIAKAKKTVTCSESDYACAVGIMPRDTIYNVKLLNLTYAEDQDYWCGTMVFNVEEMENIGTLESGESVVADVLMEGSIPNVGFSFENKEGRVFRYYLTISGEDGSLLYSPLIENKNN